MTLQEKIKNELITDLVFEYNGKFASFVPFDNNGACGIGYFYEGIECNNIDEAIDAKVFDGKSLLEIWDEVYPQISW